MAILDFWKKSKSSQDQDNGLMTQGARPALRDLTEGYKVNGDLTRGLYHNSYPGFKLAGALTYAPIAVPAAFQGLPIPQTANETTQAYLLDLVNQRADVIGQIIQASHRDGTVWVWPSWHADSSTLVWEIIQDDVVTDLVKDTRTGELIEVIVTERLTYTTGENKQDTVDRVRRFRKDLLIDRGEQFKNVLGILPIAFSNLPEPGKIRGHSDLERIIPQLKVYNDVLHNVARQLSTFQPKLVQSTENVPAWKANNGVRFETFDPAKMDFVLNLTGKEDTKILVPQGLATDAQQVLNTLYWQIVQTSGIPEFLWGLVSTGNHASAEQQMSVAMQYVRAKQTQDTAPWLRLFQASLQILAAARFVPLVDDLRITWNALDSLSPLTRAQVLKTFSEACAKMVEAGVPLETVHKLALDFYPEQTEPNFETWRKQAVRTAAFGGLKSATYADQQAGNPGEDLQPDGLDAEYDNLDDLQP